MNEIASFKEVRCLLKGNWIFLGFACLLGTLYRTEWSMIILILLLFYLLYLSRLQKFSRYQLLFVACLFLLYLIRSELDQHLLQTNLAGDESEFVITFMHPLKLEGNLFTAYGRDESRNEKLAIQYRLHSEEEQDKLSKLPIGLCCHVRGKLKEPEGARNPDAFDYKRYLEHQDIFWNLQLDKFELENCIQKDNPLIFIQNIRQKGIKYIHTHFPPDTAPLAAALIFGDRNIMDPDLMTAYQRLGIIHLIAISGLNVAMLIGILFYIGLRLEVTREKMIVVLLLFLPIYIVLTGGTPSVVRACLMILVALILKKFMKKRLLPIDILSIVFIAYIFVNPKVIYDVGFQLSFVVTLSLVLSATLLEKYSLHPIKFLIVTSLICQFASMPILLYHFYEFSAVSFFTNIFYVPLFSAVITPLLFGLYFLSLLTGSLLSPLFSFFDFCLYWLNELTLFIAKFPINTLVLGRPSLSMLFLYGVGLPFAFHRWQKAKTAKGMVIALIIPLCLLGIQAMGVKMNPYGEVTMIDVGQGDSILLRFPYGKGTYLIDTGGTIRFPTEEWQERKDPFEVGKDVVVPFLKSKGITTLDKLILTHGDADHVGGAKAILATLKVEEVVLPKVEEKSELEEELMDLAEKKEIPIYFAKTGDRWTRSDNIFSILSPNSDDFLDRNNQSIVIYAVIAGVKWLFTGDLEEEGEIKLMEEYPSLSIDILKVGHHGSNTSTSSYLLERLEPKIALISAGKDNRFGHPHHDVLLRLEEAGVRIYRTDMQGAITYRFRGKQGTFLTEINIIK